MVLNYDFIKTAIVYAQPYSTIGFQGEEDRYACRRLTRPDLPFFLYTTKVLPQNFKLFTGEVINRKVQGLLTVSDSVNRGTSIARRMHASLYDWIVYKRGSKAKERKGEEGERRSKLYTILWLRDCNYVKLSEIVRDCPRLSATIYRFPPVPQFRNGAVTLPPPPVKPALRLCMSVLCPQGVLIVMLFRQLVVFIMLVFYLFVQVLQRSRFIRVSAMELLKLLGTTYKILYRVLSRVRVISFPTNAIF